MSQVKRLYVEKKPSYAVKAKELAEELKAYLSIDDVSNVRVLIRYDVENVSAETMEKAAVTVFSEPPVDDLYEEDFPKKDGDKVFSVEFLPGQFDQRADSASTVSYSFLMRRKNQSFVLQQLMFFLVISVTRNWRRLKNTVSTR